VALKRGGFVTESSLWQPGCCGLEMPVGTCKSSGETGGLAGGLPLVRLGGESSGSARCVRGGVDGLRCVALLRAACCVLRVRVAYAGRDDSLRCVELLPSQMGLLP
jgi:hypothetical protein